MNRYPDDPGAYSCGHSFRDSARKRRHAAANRKFLRQEKLRRGCEITGRKFPPEELVWHHVGHKSFNISSGIYRSRKSLLRELGKCVLVHTVVHDRIHESPLWAAHAAEIHRLRRKRSLETE